MQQREIYKSKGRTKIWFPWI